MTNVRVNFRGVAAIGDLMCACQAGLGNSMGTAAAQPSQGCSRPSNSARVAGFAGVFVWCSCKSEDWQIGGLANPRTWSSWHRLTWYGSADGCRCEAGEQLTGPFAGYLRIGFVESLFKQFNKCIHRSLGVDPGGPQMKLSSLTSTQGEDAHDALAINHLTVFLNHDFARIP